MVKSDTICALATAPGLAGLAVVRVSGPQAFTIVDSVFESGTKIEQAASHTILYGKMRFAQDFADAVTVSVFRGPHSYTGEDVVEIGCHGGLTIPSLVVETLLLCGARGADAGEFTLRAFMNGKMDLTQVESVADLIHSSSAASAAVASRQLFGAFRDSIKQVRASLIDCCALLELELDFAHEGLELVSSQRIESLLAQSIQFCERISESYSSSSLLRSGFYVSLVGRPNAGKSLLYNELLNWNRSIVHDVAGTTRDFIQESVVWKGMHFVITDTAGLRESDDVVEAQGVALSESVMSNSHLILVVNDASNDPHSSDALVEELRVKYALDPSKNVVLVQNKRDLVNSEDALEHGNSIFVSARTGQGLSDIRSLAIELAMKSTQQSKDALLNQRHLSLLNSAKNSLERAILALKSQEFAESIAYEIRQAIESLGEISGESFNEEVLNSIFANFCVGK